MRNKVFSFIFMFFVIFCDTTTIQANTSEDCNDSLTRIISEPSDEYINSVFSEGNYVNRTNEKLRHHRDKTKHRNNARCRRYAQQFYKPYQHIPAYVPYGGNVAVPTNIPKPYYVPYSPTRCNTYCIPCPTSNCRRRCPPDPAPYRTTNVPRPTPRTTARTRSSPRTRTTPRTPAANKACSCDPDGSKFLMCNVTSGECVCKPHFTGFTCDTCQDGFWKIDKDCIECACNQHGSVNDSLCDKQTGKCSCKSGAAGDKCDTCLPDHYGSIQIGCKKCDPCHKKGHICDPSNGKCVCPPLTRGSDCQVCSENAWGFEPDIGCKACDCSEIGSLKLQCDQTSGKCTCKSGYEGDKCNQCSFGYYGFPNCRRCDCDILGTVEEECHSGLCRCSSDGTCSCKENVQGQKCEKCKDNNYGLTKDNSKGCTNCFCFNRSDTCEDAHYNWDKIRMEKMVEDTNSIEVVGDILMLPSQFLGDLTPSYGGYLSVVVPGGAFQVHLEGNGVTLQNSGINELQVVESSGWKITSRNLVFPKECDTVLNRSCFMVVLQRVTKFRIETQGRINEVLLDTAKSNIPTYTLTHSVEKCKCPSEYTGLSCQNPNEGYYRYYPKEQENTWIDRVIGIAKMCECNEKSKQCDPNSGHCRNCSSHTTGNYCELCATGYYLDQNGECSACLCPSADQNNAESCSPTSHSFICKCKEGYNGNFCDQCDKGYYDKNQSVNATKCEPCDCNPYGILPLSDGYCDELGRCLCKDGFKGNKCDQCVGAREYIKDGVCSPCDECAQLLFDEIDKIEIAVNETFGLFKDGLAPPWKVLTDSMEKNKMLSGKFGDIKEKADHLLEHANIKQYEDTVATMKDNLNKYNDIAKNNLANIDKLYDNSSQLIQETDDLNKRLIDIVRDLDGFGKEHITLEEALNRARHIQKQIKQISDRIDELEDKSVFAFCSNISQQVDHIYSYSPLVPYKSLNDLKSKLNDLIDTTAYVDTISKLAENKNTENVERMKNLKAKLEYLAKNKDIVMSSVEDILSKIDAINDVMNQLQIVYEELKSISEFPEYEELDKRVRRQMEISPEVDDLYVRAINHIEELENKVNDYSSMFNFTREEWRKINASGAYEAIINGITEAKNKAKLSREILENATKIIDPESSDHLVDKANLAHAYSDRLKQRINNFKNISKDLSTIKNKLDDLKYSILENGKSNNDLTQILHRMETQITSQADKVAKIEEVIGNSTSISDDMREVEKKVNDIHFDKQHIFFKEYQNFLNLTTADEINSLTNKMKHTRRKLQDLNISSTYLDSVKKFNNQNVQDKIRELQLKITYAQQAADMISVAMNLTNCMMSYRLRKSEFFQSLSITYKCRNCKIFRWTKNTGEIFEISVEHSKIKVKIDEEEVAVDDKVSKGETEKTIEIQKTGSQIKILLDGIVKKNERVNSHFNVMNSDDEVEVGSLKGSDGYIVKILLNEKIVGLWNFKATKGRCKGQKRDRSDVPNTNLKTYYTGEGYSVYGTNTLNPQKLSWSFDLSTFDENVLIYLATTDNCAQYISLYLENGFVKFVVHHSEVYHNTQISNVKINDGKNYKVEITMSYKGSKQHYNLVVKTDDGELLTDKSDNIVLPKTNVVKIRQTSRYLGGVPPIFKQSCVPFSTRSLLGFLKPEAPFTNETSSFGILQVDKVVLAFSNVWINGSGFLAVKWKTTDIDTISFIVKPTKPNGVILEFGEGNKIYIDNYNVVLMIKGESYISNNSLNVNDYNEVQLRFRKQKTMTINDKKEEIGLSDKIHVETFIFIGNSGFVGGIRDIIINSELLLLNQTTVKEFSKVEIGRDKDKEVPSAVKNINTKSLTLNPNFTNSMQNTERCAPFANYVTDPDAIKFGDEANTYTYIKTNFWRGDYKLQFEFRTFYPNGVIFITCSQKIQNYIFLELREGKLRLIIKGKKKKLPVTFNKKMNDGTWHTVEFIKRKRKLSIVLDREKRKPIRIPRSNVKDEIYLGGVPEESDYKKIKDLKDKIHPFRGCMKSLVINGEHKFLMEGSKDIIHSNIRQCFPNVEEGAYFGGDAYAVYKENYRINKVLELSFEFRTAEQNGIFLSISNSRRSPALSVELQNGAVVMAVDMGNGAVSNVTNNLYSDFALCNNQWHNVTALYSSSELTVNVDGIRKSWVQSEDNSMFEEIEAPLFIGGLNEGAPAGTLKSRENFKGCIRKLKIEDRLMDWSDMKELSNVLLNSCPVISNENSVLDDET